jgi:Flp pilus assembly protein TadG
MSKTVLARFLRARDGAAIMEFAFIVPIMLLLAAGITELGRAYHIYNSTNKLAVQYAEAWADCKTACQAEMASYTNSNVISNITPVLNPGALTLRMLWVTANGASTTVAYSSPSGVSWATMTTAEQNVITKNLIPSGATGVIVSASYTFTPQYFPVEMANLMGSPLTAAYTVAQVVVN